MRVLLFAWADVFARGHPRPVLGSLDINRLAAPAAGR